jgi:hypothetical protein
VLPKTFYNGRRKIPRQKELDDDNRNPAHSKFDAILKSPDLLFTPQSNPTVEDLVELFEGLKELWVGSGIAELVTEEGTKLVEAVQTTPSNYIKQFLRGERERCGLNCTRGMA